MTSTPAARAPRADARRNRQRVLDAASVVFAEHGTKATLNDVARHAGVGVGTVYRKFPDKDALLDELFAHKIDSLLQLAGRAASLQDAGEAFRELLLGLMEIRATDRGLDSILAGPGRGDRFTHELAQEFLPAVDGLVARAIRAGALRADFQAQEVCLLAHMVGKVADITRGGDPDAWRRYAQLIVDGTRPSPAPLAPPSLSFQEVAAALGRDL
ncbi:TetR/AcrR family transcriptional regulator [Aeromicrobium chenweiae]|uniref:TetR family transcriptional regulator n=1 Tax=Aeromicrobium chenweiae TaxID=2079793 RepID=A0A2S0WME7_9ACTN|nr:TetR/AcrR family transcriptional regulator [Aeromicrobium chenweiae]AWB92472.1 TetR family transcriptional regulator [Aeromicrobium chenweiae]TGN31236.1 TetR/AcrR family transcriptional regulator [Aeromicrobium chenweiae]